MTCTCSLRVRLDSSSQASRADSRLFSSTLPLMSSLASRASSACLTRLSPMPSLPTVRITSRPFAMARSWARCLLVNSIGFLLLLCLVGFLLQIRLQLSGKVPQGVAPMGDGVLLLRRQLGEVFFSLG